MKIVFCVAVIMTLLAAPFALDFTPAGKAYAMGGGGGGSDGATNQALRGVATVDLPPGDGDSPHPTPEPGTLLLLGVGLVGVAFYARNKFKK